METKEIVSIEKLVNDGVLILKEEYLIQGDEVFKLKEERKTYGNWEEDRDLMVSEQPENVVEAVLAFWGSEILENPASQNNE